MVALALGLRSRGHAVRFCGPSDFRRLVEAHGFEFVDIGVDARRFLDENPEVTRGRLRAFGATKALMGRLIDRQFEIVAAAADGVDVMIGAGAFSAPSSVAEARRLPYRYVAYGSMAIPSRYSPPYLFPRPGLPPLANTMLWRLTDLMLGSFAGPAINRNRQRLGLPSASRLSRLMTAPGSLMLAADPELSPPPFDYDPSIVVTGPLQMRHEDDGRLPPEIEAFLQSGPAPVYIGFGSMTDADPGATTRTIVDAVRAAGTRAVVSSGWAGLGDALPAGCIACGEVRHDLLLPRLAGIVHHGGAGTTAAAARAGVPQLIVPHLLDQFYWGGRVAALGLGPRPLPRRALTAASLAGRLTAMTQDAAMRATAAALSTQLRGRDGVALAVSALEAQIPGRPPPAR